MNIYYDLRTAKWYQSDGEAAVTIGGDQLTLPYHQQDEEQSIRFHVNVHHLHAGPFIGIMTARKADGTITGNSTLFIELQKKLSLLGGISFIFTPDDAAADYIIGYTFLSEGSQWKKVKVPYPDLVYNRIPFRKSERDITCRKVFDLLKEKKIPFFNPCFLDKFTLYCLFQKSRFLKNHLPKTALANNKSTLFSFLNEYKSVYLKPSQSAKGKGIFRLTAMSPPEILLEGLKRQELYHDFDVFWEEWENVFIDKHYLVQEEVQSARLEGKKFDLRILAHAEKDGYCVTGVGLRQAQEQELTTHIPNGGRLLSYQLIQSNEHDQFIKRLVNEIGKILSAEFGFFGEFSVDACVSHSGNYYIYEVNSKPMSFDEPEIEERKMAQLCTLFLQQTDFLSG